MDDRCAAPSKTVHRYTPLALFVVPLQIAKKRILPHRNGVIALAWAEAKNGTVPISRTVCDIRIALSDESVRSSSSLYGDSGVFCNNISDVMLL